MTADACLAFMVAGRFAGEFSVFRMGLVPVAKGCVVFKESCAEVGDRCDCQG